MNAIKTTHEKKGDLILLGGQILFDETDNNSVFQLLAGEVVILRNGQVVDLIEAGEVIGADIWPGGTAVAWTDCVLQTIENQPQITPLFVAPAVLDRQLALAA